MPERVEHLEEEEIIVRHPGLLVVALLAEHALGGAVDLPDGHRPVEGVELGGVPGVDARSAAQGHDLGLPELLGIDAVAPA